MQSLFLVMTGGAIGAGARHLVGRASLSLFGPGFPWGTLIVNLAGGFLMGVLVAGVARLGSGEEWRLFLGVGVLGGFTTFSAFSLEGMNMIQRGEWLLASGYALVSVIGSFAVLALGLWTARGLA